MITFHSIIIIHSLRKQIIFYGQLSNEVLQEKQLLSILDAGKQLLIGQSKIITIEQDKFILANLEDIITCLHVNEITKADEKALIKLSLDIGNIFKEKYQSDIDEFGFSEMDANSVFNKFADDLAMILERFIKRDESPPDSVSGSPVIMKPVESKDDSLETKQDYSSTRFPGGVIPPEEIDEILFNEYTEISNIYNVELVDGIISKNKVYIYTGPEKSYLIEIDYSNFPELPKIKLPSDFSSILASSQVYQEWNHENPPKIVKLINELENLIISMSSSLNVNSITNYDEYSSQQENITSPSNENKKGAKEEKVVASSILADRLLKKEPDESSKPVSVFFSSSNQDAAEKKDDVSDKPVIVKDSSPEEDSGSSIEIISTDESSSKIKTPLKHMLTSSSKSLVDSQESTRTKESTPGDDSAPKRKFVIKPKFKVPDEEGYDERLYSSKPEKLESKAPANEAKQEKALGKALEKINNMPLTSGSVPGTKISTIATKNKGLLIPSVNDLDNFVPISTIKKPELKPISTFQPKSGGASRSPASRTNDRSNKTQESTEKKTPAKKKKSDDVLFDWSEDEDEMIIKPKREIKDFDFEIKKVD
ncbi:MAG: hypothetical protein ACTSVI_13025 [Promethearchaeota archaeon]